MRTSINLDAEVHSFVSAYAAANGISLSHAVGELIRRAERASEPDNTPSRLKSSPHGYLVIARTGHPLTSEMVKDASEDGLV